MAAAAAVLIQPNTSFLRRVVVSGGGDLKKCMQCGTCSVVRAQSPGDAPYSKFAHYAYRTVAMAAAKARL